MLIMEVDPPSFSNISTSVCNSHAGVHSGFVSQDLESPMNTNTMIPAPGLLKRSSSAPMINLVSSAACREISPPSDFLTNSGHRTRHLSSTSLPLHSSTAPVKVANRLNQLKQEESQITARDIQKEREVQSALQISTSLTEFSLSTNEPVLSKMAHWRRRSCSESLHIVTSPCMLVGSPSPTRVGKQCFSPSMQATIKTITFISSASLSPTRMSFHRSLSPVIIRPSPLGKRKLEIEGDIKYENLKSPPKKFHTSPSTQDKVIPHPLSHSISSSSCDSSSNSSPEQLVSPTNRNDCLTTCGRPQPHLYGFMPLSDSFEMQTTDSDASDVTIESTDMSERGDLSSSNSSMLLTTYSTPAGHMTAFTPVNLCRF